MRVLLPPSETKRPGGVDEPLAWESLAFPDLTATRQAIMADLVRLCADEDVAAKALKLGPRSRSELQHNRALETSPVMPALERYTGVLFDAVDVPAMSPELRSRANQVVWIFSALFGPLRATDPIPVYRLSFDTALGGDSLVQRWSVHAERIFAEDFTVDLRSSGYRGLAPIPPGRGVYVHVVRDRAGRQAVGHHNKATKGRLVRDLLGHEVTVESAADLIDWGRSSGYELVESERGDEVLLVLEAR